MKIFLSSQFIKSYQRLKKKNPKITSLVKQKINFFKNNPSYPSLRLHKLQGKKIVLWSFWIKGNLRITFAYTPKGILFIDIGSHKQVY